MRYTLAGRVDLVWALRPGGGRDLQEALGSLLGLELKDESPSRKQGPPEAGARRRRPRHKEEKPTDPPAFHVPFWQASLFRPVGTLDSREQRRDKDVAPVPTPHFAPMAFAPLSSSTSLLTRLRRLSVFSDLSGDLDIDQIVDRLGRCQFLPRLPRLPRARWSTSIQVIVDRSRRLAPYWDDQNLAVWDLQALYGENFCQVAVLADGGSEPYVCDPPGDVGRYAVPEGGKTVLVLGDLGSLDRDRDRAVSYWFDLGRRLIERGNKTLAVVPCHPDRCPPRLATVWTILPWESPDGARGRALDEQEAREIAHRILVLLAPALRVEPRMIRAVRRTIPACRWDPGIESIVWQDEALIGRVGKAAVFHPQRVGALRELRRSESLQDRGTASEIIRRAHLTVYPGIWYSALLAAISHPYNSESADSVSLGL